MSFDTLGHIFAGITNGPVVIGITALPFLEEGGYACSFPFCRKVFLHDRWIKDMCEWHHYCIPSILQEASHDSIKSAGLPWEHVFQRHLVATDRRDPRLHWNQIFQAQLSSQLTLGPHNNCFYHISDIT